MSISVTAHGNQPIGAAAKVVTTIGPQLSAAQPVSVAGTSKIGPLSAGLYRIKCLATCTVRIRPGDGTASGGEVWSAGEKEIRYVPEGGYIIVGAA